MVCDFKFDIYFEDYNGFMNLNIKANGTTFKVESSVSSIVVMKIELPTTIEFHVSGKNMDIDTKINHNGNILCDKHILITNISIDHFDVPPKILDTIILSGRSDKTTGAYFGINGIATLNFGENNAFKQYIIHNN